MTVVDSFHSHVQVIMCRKAGILIDPDSYLFSMLTQLNNFVHG